MMCSKNSFCQEFNLVYDIPAFKDYQINGKSSYSKWRYGLTFWTSLSWWSSFHFTVWLQQKCRRTLTEDDTDTDQHVFNFPLYVLYRYKHVCSTRNIHKWKQWFDDDTNRGAFKCYNFELEKQQTAATATRNFWSIHRFGGNISDDQPNWNIGNQAHCSSKLNNNIIGK